jgi:hypothetical protein
MKLAATTLTIVFAFFSNGAHAQVRGGQLNRSLQANGGNVNCIYVTGSDGVRKTVTPCTTPAPVTTTTTTEGGNDRAPGGGAMTTGGGMGGGMM